jgi:hypothetical protein
MIPRTVKMAAEVAAIFTPTELGQYGNIILNGYPSTIPNTTGKLAWQYKETTTPPVPLPSVTGYYPTLKGWSTNYMEYYTRSDAPDYPVNPGDPTMFEYTVHSYTPATGAIATLSDLQGGSGYITGVYLSVPLISPRGSGATGNITVGPSGTVTSVTIANGGNGYAVGDGFTATALIGPGSGFVIFASSIIETSPASQPQWAQCPRRVFQNQVSTVTPPQNVNNPQVIQYSFIYPVADKPVAPPIDYVAP